MPPQPRGGRDASRPAISDVYAGGGRVGCRSGDDDSVEVGTGGTADGTGRTIGVSEESGATAAAAGGSRFIVPSLRGDDVVSNNSNGSVAGAGIMSPAVVSRAKRLLAGVSNMDESADVRRLAGQALEALGGARAS